MASEIVNSELDLTEQIILFGVIEKWLHFFYIFPSKIHQIILHSLFQSIIACPWYLVNLSKGWSDQACLALPKHIVQDPMG